MFPVAFAMFKLIEKTIGLRVSPEEELEGLDFIEHGGNAYPDQTLSSRPGLTINPSFAAARIRR